MMSGKARLLGDAQAAERRRIRARPRPWAGRCAGSMSSAGPSTAVNLWSPGTGPSSASLSVAIYCDSRRRADWAIARARQPARWRRGRWLSCCPQAAARLRYPAAAGGAVFSWGRECRACSDLAGVSDLGMPTLESASCGPAENPLWSLFRSASGTGPEFRNWLVADWMSVCG